MKAATRSLPSLGIKHIAGITHATSTLPCRGPEVGEQSKYPHHCCLLNLHSLGPQSGEDSKWLHHQAFSKITTLHRRERDYRSLACLGIQNGRGQRGHIILGVAKEGRNSCHDNTPAFSVPQSGEESNGRQNQGLREA